MKRCLIFALDSVEIPRAEESRMSIRVSSNADAIFEFSASTFDEIYLDFRLEGSANTLDFARWLSTNGKKARLVLITDEPVAAKIQTMVLSGAYEIERLPISRSRILPPDIKPQISSRRAGFNSREIVSVEGKGTLS